MRMTGDVAQWVERLLRMQEAGGSNPPISTITRISLFVSRESQKTLTHTRLKGFEADPSASSGGKVNEANVNEGGRLRRKSVSDGGEGIPLSPP